MSIQVSDQEITRANLEAFNRIVSAFPPPPPLPAEVYRAAENLGIPEDQVEDQYFGKFRTLPEFAREVVGHWGPSAYPGFPVYGAVNWREIGRYFLTTGDFLRYRGHYFSTAE